MSHRKDTDYLAISARIRAMETRMLTREKMDRMIDARDTAEAMKVLDECGYTGGTLDEMLARARDQVFRDMVRSVPDPRLVEVFQIKYDYHNAKAILKALAMGQDPSRLLLEGGRYAPTKLLDDWQRESLRDCSPVFLLVFDVVLCVFNQDVHKLFSFFIILFLQGFLQVFQIPDKPSQITFEHCHCYSSYYVLSSCVPLDCLYYNTLIKCMQVGMFNKDTLIKLCILYTC